MLAYRNVIPYGGNDRTLAATSANGRYLSLLNKYDKHPNGHGQVENVRVVVYCDNEPASGGDLLDLRIWGVVVDLESSWPAFACNLGQFDGTETSGAFGGFRQCGHSGGKWTEIFEVPRFPALAITTIATPADSNFYSVDVFI